MTNQEAIKILKGAIKKPNTKDGYLGQALQMGIEALEILDFAERELKFAIEHSTEEEKDNYQRVLNLIINKNNFYGLRKNE